MPRRPQKKGDSQIGSGQKGRILTQKLGPRGRGHKESRVQSRGSRAGSRNHCPILLSTLDSQPSTIPVGLEGLEPSPARLRAGDAATNTSIPFCFCVSIGPDGVEPSSGPYKEPALTIELQASIQSVGPEGSNRARLPQGRRAQGGRETTAFGLSPPSSVGGLSCYPHRAD